jgi:phage head maturation protease
MTQVVSRLASSGTSENLREATVRPSTWNEADRSVEVVWSTGAAVVRFDWWNNEYYNETLDLRPEAMRLQRLDDGGPVLLDHDSSVRALVGSIEPGSVRVANGEAIARIRLSGDDDVADVVSKVRDGHLRTVSVGYFVHVYDHFPGRDGERDEMRAVDWEPIEISLTPIPADPGAVLRSRSDNVTIINRHPDDNREEDRTVLYRGGKPSFVREATPDMIRRACVRARFDADFESMLLDEHEASPITEAQLHRAIVDKYASERNSPPLIDNALRDSRSGPASTLRDAFAAVLYSRMSGAPVPEGAAQYAGASMIDMARGLLEARGERVRWMRPTAVFDTLCRGGQHTTSDFAFMINSAGQRYLLDAYKAITSSLKVLARKRDFVDFRKRFAIQAEGPAFLRNVPENAEFKQITLTEGSNGAQLGTFGEIFSISRQALINDDLGVFLQMMTFWARAQAGTEANFLTALIGGTGVVMEEDGKALYHADHGNLAVSGAAISVASLSAARQQMRTIKSRDGETPADVVPKYLVVGAAKETEAEQVLASITAAAPSDVNPFTNKLQLVVDSRQVGNSWRLFADPSIHPVLEYGNLEGQDGLFTDTQVGFEVDGVAFKVRTDIGAGAIDWRGTYMNPGN